jgi:formylglycine-generating enzyme required for sulfatase activity
VTQISSYNSSQNYLTAVGSFTGSKSYYGTFDQSGDVWNWEATTVSSQYPVLRGGSWYSNNATYLWSSSVGDNSPAYTQGDYGFRVASVPEPNSIMLMLAGALGLATMRRKSYKLCVFYSLES